MEQSTNAAEIRHQIELPFSEAVKISIQSLKIRFGRSLITTGGILLGIAFLVSVVANSQISQSMQKVKGKQEITGAFAREETQEGITAKDIWLIAMALIVVVVGIANSMLMAVTERFREIGTMKCLGALNKFILELFLLESGFQGLSGAVTGALLGVLSTFLMGLKNYGFDLIWNYPLLEVLMVVVVASIIGMALSVVGAAVPALRAARMHPSEAMRVEA